MKPSFHLLLPLVVVVFTGCAIVPIPIFPREKPTGTVITQNDVRFVVAGQTTRAQVVAQLGDDYRRSPRLPVIAYAWEKPTIGVGWIWFIICPYDVVGGVGHVGRSYWRAYFVRFDAADRVETARFISLSEDYSLDEQLEDWGNQTRHPFVATLGAKIFDPKTGTPRFIEVIRANNEPVP